MGLKTIGNFSYAGTSKFVSHAQNDQGTETLCGMDIKELLNRPGQQWEESEFDDDEKDIVGCLKCNKKINKRKIKT